MKGYFVLTLNPDAKHPWERCILRNPITANSPELATLVAEAVGNEAGSYLVSVNIEVSVLEQATSLPNTMAEVLELPILTTAKVA